MKLRIKFREKEKKEDGEGIPDTEHLEKEDAAESPETAVAEEKENEAGAENIVADALIKNKIPLYYFAKDSGLEIDFIVRYKEEVTLIEVKARNGNTKSSRTVLNDNIKYPSANYLIKL